MKNEKAILIENFAKAVEIAKSSVQYALALSETIREYERQNHTEKVKIGDETFKRLDAELTDLFIKVALI